MIAITLSVNIKATNGKSNAILGDSFLLLANTADFLLLADNASKLLLN
jgi:hypothetical protein